MIMLPGDWDFFILLKNYKIGSLQIWGNFPLNDFLDKLFANEKNIVMQNPINNKPCHIEIIIVPFSKLGGLTPKLDLYCSFEILVAKIISAHIEIIVYASRFPPRPLGGR